MPVSKDEKCASAVFKSGSPNMEVIKMDKRVI
ncbi:hypothetical protein DICVIV_05430 [Dictyocaulus viviparus]|uniref:Uncharacterized protein n=1 Tax=Dictyocaulus viviparus TaxID=29172 RepID=A0A0D8XVB9_DICVI|nr:hypothetical protein DICVIV_05430 [Dictyocaulus viviparus]